MYLNLFNLTKQMIHSEILGGGKLKDKVITLLSLQHPLSAKQVFNRLKQNFDLSVTYQAVHKALKEMVVSQVLVQKEKEYEISLSWLNKINDFSEHTKREYLSIHSKIKVISFDLDGCLSDNAFDEIVWRTEIPKLYASERNISFEQAFLEVTAEYKRLWGKVEGWRDVTFWFKHFEFKTSWEELAKNVKKHINHYGDVIPVLKELQKQFTLIIISHADRRFLDLKLDSDNLRSFFTKTYSTISDFKEYKKNKELFLAVCKEMEITPEEIIHLGDSVEYDYTVPTSAGIQSFIIDRVSIEKKENVVSDLYEFKEKIMTLKQSWIITEENFFDILQFL